MDISDWPRGRIWDIWVRIGRTYKLVETLDELLSVIPASELAHFLALPAATPMPAKLRREVEKFVAAGLKSQNKEEEMTTGPAPICLFCKNYGKDLRCLAFPNGIPEDIYMSRADHRKPYTGDNGIRFEPVDAAAAEYAEELFAAD